MCSVQLIIGDLQQDGTWGNSALVLREVPSFWTKLGPSYMSAKEWCQRLDSSITYARDEDYLQHVFLKVQYKDYLAGTSLQHVLDVLSPTYESSDESDTQDEGPQQQQKQKDPRSRKQSASVLQPVQNRTVLKKRPAKQQAKHPSKRRKTETVAHAHRSAQSKDTRKPARTSGKQKQQPTPKDAKSVHQRFHNLCEAAVEAFCNEMGEPANAGQTLTAKKHDQTEPTAVTEPPTNACMDDTQMYADEYVRVAVTSYDGHSTVYALWTNPEEVLSSLQPTHVIYPVFLVCCNERYEVSPDCQTTNSAQLMVMAGYGYENARSHILRQTRLMQRFKTASGYCFYPGTTLAQVVSVSKSGSLENAPALWQDWHDKTTDLTTRYDVYGAGVEGVHVMLFNFKLISTVYAEMRFVPWTVSRDGIQFALCDNMYKVVQPERLMDAQQLGVQAGLLNQSSKACTAACFLTQALQVPTGHVFKPGTTVDKGLVKCLWFQVPHELRLVVRQLREAVLSELYKWHATNMRAALREAPDATTKQHKSHASRLSGQQQQQHIQQQHEDEASGSVGTTSLRRVIAGLLERAFPGSTTSYQQQQHDGGEVQQGCEEVMSPLMKQTHPHKEPAPAPCHVPYEQQASLEEPVLETNDDQALESQDQHAPVADEPNLLRAAKPVEAVLPCSGAVQTESPPAEIHVISDDTHYADPTADCNVEHNHLGDQAAVETAVDHTGVLLPCVASEGFHQQPYITYVIPAPSPEHSAYQSIPSTVQDQVEVQDVEAECDVTQRVTSLVTDNNTKADLQQEQPVHSSSTRFVSCGTAQENIQDQDAGSVEGWPALPAARMRGDGDMLDPDSAAEMLQAMQQLLQMLHVTPVNHSMLEERFNAVFLSHAKQELQRAVACYDRLQTAVEQRKMQGINYILTHWPFNLGL